MQTINISLLLFGIILGIKHAFDIDHIAAVSAIVAKHKSIRKSMLTGALWGIGHTISLLIFGLLILFFKIKIPENAQHFFDLIVGIMLIFLGINLLIKLKKEKIHMHRHRHDGAEHIHFHSHKHIQSHQHTHQPLIVGLIHGIAGSGAITLLVLSTIDSLSLGLIYILIFGIGSIIGMVFVSGILLLPLSLPFALFFKSFKNIDKVIKFGAATISIIVGLSIVYNHIKLT